MNLCINPGYTTHIWMHCMHFNPTKQLQCKMHITSSKLNSYYSLVRSDIINLYKKQKCNRGVWWWSNILILTVVNLNCLQNIQWVLATYVYYFTGSGVLQVPRFGQVLQVLYRTFSRILQFLTSVVEVLGFYRF